MPLQYPSETNEFGFLAPVEQYLLGQESLEQQPMEQNHFEQDPLGQYLFEQDPLGQYSLEEQQPELPPMDWEGLDAFLEEAASSQQAILSDPFKVTENAQWSDPLNTAIEEALPLENLKQSSLVPFEAPTASAGYYSMQTELLRDPSNFSLPLSLLQQQLAPDATLVPTEPTLQAQSYNVSNTIPAPLYNVPNTLLAPLYNVPHDPPAQLYTVPTNTLAAPSYNVPTNDFLVQATAPPQPETVEQRPPPDAVNQKQSKTRAPKRPKPELNCSHHQCNYSTRNSDEFRRHTDSVHKTIRRHKCNVCNIGMNDPSGLAKHKKSEKHMRACQAAGLMAGTVTKFECPGCRETGKEARFARSDQLKRHMRACNNTGRALPDGFWDGPGGMDRGRVTVE
jgi:hypothetical protein